MRRIHRFHALPGACCLVRENREELASSGVLHACVAAGFPLGPMVCIAAFAVRLRLRTAAQVRGLHGLDIERVVLAYEDERRLVVKVAPLPAHMLMLLGAIPHGLLASLAALLSACYPLLRFLELFLRLAIVPRVGHALALPIGGDER